MRFRTLHGATVFAMALLALCGTASPLQAGPISADASTFVGEFRAFVADFNRWDATHLDLPLITLALTPDQQRPEMLFLLWYLWMQDHSLTTSGTYNLPSLTSLSQVYQTSVLQTPVSTSGSGTVASTGSGDTGGGASGSTHHSSPEPTSLALAACGGLGLIAYRFVRARANRRC